nr:PREDICTED: uncharacterized protein LOC103983830 isoform X2 [Musa acuminata subsp. malaccensis]
MWLEILCGLVFYNFFRQIINGEDDFPDIDTSDSDASFAVAARLEKLYGGKAFVGLRIPDADTGTRQHIDVVLVTKREAMVVAVRNFSGLVAIDGGGNWVDKKHKSQTHLNPVIEVSRQVAVLESYLEQRGLLLPKGHVIGRVILPDSICSLELKSNRNILGEFLKFKGYQHDMQALKNVKRSKVGRFIVQKPSILGLGSSRLQLLCIQRDYQSEDALSDECKEIAVEPSTEVLFQPLNSNKLKKLKLSSIVRATLSG